MTVLRLAVLSHPDPADLRAWIACFDAEFTQVAGEVALLAWGPGRRSTDGRTSGALCGVVFNDVAVAREVGGRGVRVNLADQGALVTELVGTAGPAGLDRLRWQGSIACLHHGQALALVARDILGLGRLYCREVGTGRIIASDPSLCHAVAREAADPVDAVPPGTCGVVSAAGVRWQQQRPAPENLPFFRDIPHDLREASPEVVETGLLVRVAAAAEAARRGLDGLERGPAQHPAERWLAERLPWPATAQRRDGATCARAVAQPGGLWSLRGTAALLGQLDISPSVSAAAGLDVEPCEPVGPGIDAADVLERHRRAAWMTGPEPEAQAAAAAQRGRVLALPHLDPAVLAWLGAAPRRNRPTSAPADPTAEAPTAKG